MLQVSELPVTRWPPGAAVHLHWPAALANGLQNGKNEKAVL